MTVGVWSEARIEKASALWGQGKRTPEIMEILGCEKGQLMGVMQRCRDKFPPRRVRRLRVKGTEIRKEFIIPEPKIHTDRVTRTVMGATVTLPRVTFIDGPYLEAAE